MSNIDIQMQLARELNEAARLYYLDGSSPMSDDEYDAKLTELERMEIESGVSTFETPTRRVGSPVPKHERRMHEERMYSLSKVHDFNALDKWVRVMAMKESNGFLVEYKYDGMAAELVYRDGILLDAITRGDGRAGKSIYPHVLNMKSVPRYLKSRMNVDVRGEIIASRIAFNEYNAAHGNPLKSERNAVAGALNGNDMSLVQALGLEFVPYDVGYCEEKYDTALDMLAALRAQGLPVGESAHVVVHNIRTLHEKVNEINAGRDELDFAIDGAVVKANSFALRKQLGNTEHHPRWAIAYKFASIGMWTVLRSVSWEMSRGGRLTPVAHFDEVNLNGCDVSRASLDSLKRFEELDIAAGDGVCVVRRGDVIPRISGTRMHDGERERLTVPDKCPCCGAELIRRGAHLYCEGSKCPSAVLKRFKHFFGKDGLDIKCLGEKTLERLIDELGFTEVQQVLTMQRVDLERIGFAAGMCDKILENIQIKRDAPAHMVLSALGVPGVGKAAAYKLGTYMESYKALCRANEIELEKCPDVSQKTCECIYDFLKNDKTARFMRKWLVN